MHSPAIHIVSNDVNLITALKWLPFKNCRHCQAHNECNVWNMMNWNKKLYWIFKYFACRTTTMPKMKISYTNAEYCFALCMTFHVISSRQWTSCIWTLLKSMTINNTSKCIVHIHTAYAMLFTDSTNSFGYAILSSKVSVSIATFEIERNMKTKHIETKGTNEASSNSHLSWNWNWKTINSFCCKQTDKQFPRKKKEMQRNVWLEIVSSLTSEECKRNEIHLNTIEEMGEYRMLLLLSLSPPRILHNLPSDSKENNLL